MMRRLTSHFWRRAVAIGGLAAALVGILALGGVARVSGQAAAPGVAALSSADLADLKVVLTQTKEIRPTGQVRAFHLTAQPGSAELLPGLAAPAITYNGTVPGPTIRITEGDTLRVTLHNQLEQDTTIHWHGLHVPSAMDGVPGLSQPVVKPGETFTYEFPASHAGTFMYHPHANSVAQIDRGLYGLLLIDPQTPDPTKFDQEFTMLLGAWQLSEMSGAMPEMGAGAGKPMGMMDYNYFTINGKAFPATPEWVVKEGDLVRVRIVNISNLAHPMHLHGHDFKVIAKDGEPIRPELQQVVNTLSVDAGETYDVVFRANNPGVWAFHCHELHHTENDGAEPGGLIQVIRYEGQTPPSLSAPAAEPTPMPAQMPGMGH